MGKLLTSILVGAVLGSILGCSINGLYALGYKKGQIDHANNIIKYELQENKKGETVWKKIKDKL